MKRLLRLAPFALLLPTLAIASPVWKGDFETGNLSQWDREQSVSSSRLLVVNSPVREGRYALKVTVRKGDDPINASGNRNEVLYLGREEPGSEYFYKWSTLFPSSFPRSSKWALFTQWHHDGNGGSPPIEFYVVDDQLRLRVGGSSGKIVWTSPLRREHWNDFVLHVKWSPDPKVGFVELYHDGKVVLPKMKVATQYSGQRNYLKIGLYRDESISQEGVVFHDGFIQATSKDDVIPPVVATPTPETPAPETPDSEPGSDPGDVSSPPDDSTDGQPGTVVQAPSEPGDSSPGTDGVIPGDASLGAGMQAASCGASSTGGTPLLVAAALTLAALLGRRKAVPAHARARRTR
ncbi:heparin lyase I family protein [Archangium violaceum]|uniref:polysaccharide lyase n=1 Tax=Archangium violaceum TaxID=83451 RepID=UPI00193AFB28|nr:polysaccharide lyase [Archangium violaceum]QRK12535.1 heparin lyase I family protein [Archangium violaceum]